MNELLCPDCRAPIVIWSTKVIRCTECPGRWNGLGRPQPHPDGVREKAPSTLHRTTP